MSADPVVAEVLSRYPSVLVHGALTCLGNRGGFSGARLWRIDNGGTSFCLRAWPASTTGDRLHFIQRLLLAAHVEGLTIVPQPLATAAGMRVVMADGRLWDLTTWLPGCADFHAHPSSERLASAACALAQIHRCWEQHFGTTVGPCPAVERRLERWRQWQNLLESGWCFTPARDDPAAESAARAWELLPTWFEQIPRWLAVAAQQVWPLQPCIVDPWHDHFLFQDARLTGLIDHGAASFDHVAVDLARMLGSLVADDGAARRTALRAYRVIRPLTEAEEALGDVLDRSGTVLALTTWLRWLYEGGRLLPDRTDAARRLATLVQRVRLWR